MTAATVLSGLLGRGVMTRLKAIKACVEVWWYNSEISVDA
jgi:hypothetical protein